MSIPPSLWRPQSAPQADLNAVDTRRLAPTPEAEPAAPQTTPDQDAQGEASYPAKLSLLPTPEQRQEHQARTRGPQNDGLRFLLWLAFALGATAVIALVLDDLIRMVQRETTMERRRERRERRDDRRGREADYEDEDEDEDDRTARRPRQPARRQPSSSGRGGQTSQGQPPANNGGTTPPVDGGDSGSGDHA